MTVNLTNYNIYRALIKERNGSLQRLTVTPI
jgi:hypothetical protein